MFIFSTVLVRTFWLRIAAISAISIITFAISYMTFLISGLYIDLWLFIFAFLFHAIIERLFWNEEHPTVGSSTTDTA